MRQIVIFSALCALSACGKPSALKVEEATVKLPAVPGNPGSGYFTLVGGPVAEQLMSVSSPQIIRTEMHDNVMENGMMKMKPIEGGVEVPAGGKISFAPRGKHVMLYDINPAVKAGSTVSLTFSFASGATLKTDAKVQSPGDSAEHAH